MVFDDEPIKVIDGHKFWKPEQYKGYTIQPYESPNGDQTFLVGDGKQWIYDSKKLEGVGAFIDMCDVSKKFKEKGKKNG